MTEPPIHVSAEGAHPHPRHVGQRWLDLAIALSAIFISLVSLVVAIEHGKTERDLVAANSWPFLREIRSNFAPNDADPDVTLGLSNGGVGPAKVKSFQILYRGSAVTSALDLLRRCCGLSADQKVAASQLHGIFFSMADDTVLRPGESNVVLKLRRSSAPDVAKRLSDAVSEIGFRACYCSILDECWTSSLQSADVRPVKACPTPVPRYDPNGK